MDNTSRFYRDEYLEARAHAVNGRPDKCLEILWHLRLQPDLSLYRRALVNHLIATQVDIREHPDVKKFANEALVLVAQIRREGRYNTSDPTEEVRLKKIEDHANKTLVDIDTDVAAIKEQDKKEVDDSLAFQTKNLTVEHSPTRIVFLKDQGRISEEPQDKPGVHDEPMETFQSESERQRPKLWTIEGMYTDHGKGFEKEETGTGQKPTEVADGRIQAQALRSIAEHENTDASLFTSPPPSSPPRGPSEERRQQM